MFKVGSTTVIDNSGLVPLAQITLAAGNITSATPVISGDGHIAYGGVACSCYAVSFASNALVCYFQTNCACDCLCVCGGG